MVRPPGGALDEEEVKRGIYVLPKAYGLKQVAKDHLGLEEYSAADLPIVGTTALGETKFHVADPDIIRDMMTKNNKLIDKDGLTDIGLRPFMGNSFLFSKTTDQWSRKRKGAAHAFYKDRLKLMMYTMQEVTVKTFNQWIEGIEGSKDGKTVIDISKEFQTIFARNIIAISFGDDISDLLIDQCVETEAGSGKYVMKKYNYSECVRLLESLATSVLKTKFLLPLNWFWKYTDKLYSFTRRQRIFDANCQRVRDFTMDYVQKRKAGKIKSKARGESDLLSLFLSASEIFSDEDIVDEMQDFFAAAAETSQNST